MGNKESTQGDEKTKDCRVWTGVNHETFLYPELEPGEFPEFAEKANFGIALSGGGFRAASIAIGTLRGLHQLGILSKSRYVSSNSGSSWVIGPLSYTRGDLSSFLGEYLPPEECTLSNLRKVDVNCHSRAISCGTNLNTFVSELAKGIFTFHDKDTRGFWAEAVGRIFFQHYGLDNCDHLPIISRDPDPLSPLTKKKYTPYDPNRSPLPIINATAVVRGECMFTPVEFTPMYYSFPAYVNFHQEDKCHLMGGYLVEPHGFTSHPDKSQRDAIKQLVNPNNAAPSSMEDVNRSLNSLSPQVTCVEIPRPEQLVSVSDQTGISSSALAQTFASQLSNTEGELLDITVYPIWNPVSGEVHKMMLADGGGSDNTGIIALLRRKVTKIFAMYTINVPIMMDNYCNISQSSLGNVAGLFGLMTCDGEAAPDGTRPKEFNKYRQVFPSEDYQRLIEGLQARYVEGKPCSFLLRTQALPNSLVSVPGNHSVELLFMVCAPTDNWVNSLPSDTQRKVLKQRKAIDRMLNKRKNQANGDGDAASDDDKGNGETDDDKDEEDDEDVQQVHENDKKKKKTEFLEDLKFRIAKLTRRSASISPAGLLTPSEFRNKFQTILKSSNLMKFPYPPLDSFDYTAQLVNLLTHLMTWEVLESRDLFEELLGSEVLSK
jgi:hypothetical protein